MCNHLQINKILETCQLVMPYLWKKKVRSIKKILKINNLNSDQFNKWVNNLQQKKFCSILKMKINANM